MAKIKLALKTLNQIPVPTPGTPVQLSATEFLVRQAVIQYDPNNTGNIYVGEADVDPAKCIVLSASNPAIELCAEDTVADEDNVFFDLADIYIDAENAGEKVNVVYTEMSEKSYNS